MNTSVHNPPKLTFTRLWFFGGGSADVTFNTGKGSSVEIQLTEGEIQLLKEVVESAQARAMREIPEVMAEIKAETRVAEILAEREAALLEAPKPAQSPNEEVPF